MKKILLLLILIMAITGQTFAVDWTSFPDEIKPGDMIVDLPTVSIGPKFLGILGINVNYALDLPIPLTVGYYMRFLIGGSLFSFSPIPSLLSVGYHPDFGIEDFNFYAMLKLGFLLLALGETAAPFPLAISFNVGARYYNGFKGIFVGLADVITGSGFFAELGIDSYLLLIGREDGKKYTYTFAPILHIGTFFNIDRKK